MLVNENTENIWRIDEGGNQKIHIYLDFDFTISNLQIHNLVDGGFLLLTAKTEAKDEHYYLTKVDAKGHRIGLLQFPGPQKNLTNLG